MNMKKIILSLLSLGLLSSPLWAQGTLADYQRAFNIRSQYSGKVKNTSVQPHAIGDTHRFWYAVYDGEKQVFKEVDADKLSVTILPSDPTPPRHWHPQGPQPRQVVRIPWL